MLLYFGCYFRRQKAIEANLANSTFYSRFKVNFSLDLNIFSMENRWYQSSVWDRSVSETSDPLGLLFVSAGEKLQLMWVMRRG